jgi:CMD domain protein
MTGQAASADVIDQLAGIRPGSPVAAVRDARPDVRELSQGSFDALFELGDPGDLSMEERLLTALRGASANALPTMIELYEGRLVTLGSDPGLIAAVKGSGDTSALSPRLLAILTHADLLTHEPSAATPAHLEQLRAAGLTTRAIVTLSQLIAFIGYQARVVVGLKLLEPAA